MWEYNYNYAYMSEDELMHYGVKGMKWGHRKKYYNKDGSLNKLGRAKKKMDDADRTFYKTQKFKDIKKNYKNAVSAELNYMKVHRERNKKVKSKYKELQKKASLGEKLTYNKATRKLAAKYIVDNNMTVKEATAKSQSVAKRNTAIILAAYGAVTVATLYANKK